MLKSNAVQDSDRQAEIITCFQLRNKRPQVPVHLSKRAHFHDNKNIGVDLRPKKQTVLRNTMAEQHTERENGDEFVNKLKKFLQDGCGCTLGPKDGPCSQQFSEDTAMFNLNNCLELSSAELDLVILASIQAFTRSESVGEKRRSPRCRFYFQSKPICKEMFLHLYGVSYSRFRRLKEHYEKQGIAPRQHGNAK